MKTKNASQRDNGVWTNRVKVQSESDARRFYIVSIRATDNRYCCSCMHWTRHCNAAGTDCKHILTVKNDGRRQVA